MTRSWFQYLSNMWPSSTKNDVIGIIQNYNLLKTENKQYPVRQQNVSSTINCSCMNGVELPIL